MGIHGCKDTLHLMLSRLQQCGRFDGQMHSSSAQGRDSATFSKEVQLMPTDFLNDYLFGAASELVTQKVMCVEELSHKVKTMEKALKDFLPPGGLATSICAWATKTQSTW